ncbi:MAG: hypothetical protein ACE365_04865 [Gammaproteobacteria bacterium]
MQQLYQGAPVALFIPSPLTPHPSPASGRGEKRVKAPIYLFRKREKKHSSLSTKNEREEYDIQSIICQRFFECALSLWEMQLLRRAILLCLIF